MFNTAFITSISDKNSFLALQYLLFYSNVLINTLLKKHKKSVIVSKYSRTKLNGIKKRNRKI
jgi:hypothetical protein